MLLVMALLAAQAQSVPGLATPLKPLSSPASWVMPDDYPAEAMRDEHEGKVGVRLEIDSTGLPVGCSIISSSGFEELDRRTCSILTNRARFSPARDPKGKPIAASYSTRMTWSLPPLELPAATPASRGPWMTHDDYPASENRQGHVGSLSFILLVSPAGLPARCTIAVSSGYPVLDKATCDILMRRARFSPAISVTGKATHGYYFGKFRWSLPGESPEKSMRSHSAAPNVIELAFPKPVSAAYNRPIETKVVFGPTGDVVDCEISQSSGSPALDRFACQQLQRLAIPGAGKSSAPGKNDGLYTVLLRTDAPYPFGPARDANGTAGSLPVAQVGQLELTVAALPSGYRQPVKAGVLFDKDHRVTDCRIVESSGSPAVDRAACAQLRLLSPDETARSAPAAGPQEYIVSFRVDAPAKP